LNETNSLSARVLKVVYYPSTDFLNVKLGVSPSRVWRAISEGRDVLSHGIIRRIGSAETTNIWRTNWLPRDGQLQPISCPRPDVPQLVKDLIDPLT